MIYTVEFYSKMRGEEIKVAIEAPDRNLAVKGICRYYRTDSIAVRTVKETPESKPKFQIRRIPGTEKYVTNPM